MIGKMPTTFNNGPMNTSRLSGLFLNTENWSPCDGNVTAWDFCYYINVTRMSNITIQAGVWRESSGSYTLVNDSLIDLPIPNPEPGFQFVCRHWFLDKCRDEPPFEVEVGDIVGMYVDDTSGSNMVHILGMPPSNEPNAGIMKSNDTSIDIENDIVSNSTLTQMDYSLYLVAVLGTLYSIYGAILYIIANVLLSMIQVIGTTQSHAQPPPQPLIMLLIHPPPQPLILVVQLMHTVYKNGQ
jgi:hypothetical protein